MTEKDDAMWGPEAGEYIAQQRAEIKRLRAALEPFAKMAELLNAIPGCTYDGMDGGDLDRARKALAND